jgi:hypothetical protein
MKRTLQDRINSGIRGAIPLTDSHKNIHQDTLTYILRLEARLAVFESFFHYAAGWVDERSEGKDGLLTSSLRGRLRAANNDLKRIPGEHIGC